MSQLKSGPDPPALILFAARMVSTRFGLHLHEWGPGQRGVELEEFKLALVEEFNQPLNSDRWSRIATATAKKTLLITVRANSQARLKYIRARAKILFKN